MGSFRDEQSRRRAGLPADVRAFLAAAGPAEGRTLAGLVFADYLDDAGRPDLADWLRLVHRRDGEFTDLRLLALELALTWGVDLPRPGGPAADQAAGPVTPPAAPPSPG